MVYIEWRKRRTSGICRRRLGNRPRLHKFRGGRICHSIIKTFIFIANAKPPSLSSPSFLLVDLLRTAKRCTCRKGRDPGYPFLDFARNVHKSTSHGEYPRNQDQGPIFCVVDVIRPFCEGGDAKTEDKAEGNVSSYRSQVRRIESAYEINGRPTVWCVFESHSETRKATTEHLALRFSDNELDACPNRGAGCNCRRLRTVRVISELCWYKIWMIIRVHSRPCVCVGLEQEV